MNARAGTSLVVMVAAVVVATSTMVLSTGCATDAYTRNVEITHWYDDDTVILIYTRQKTQGGLGAMLGRHPETVHARICTIQDDNSMECSDQRRPTNLLNPHLYEQEYYLGDDWRP